MQRLRARARLLCDSLHKGSPFTISKKKTRRLVAVADQCNARIHRERGTQDSALAQSKTQPVRPFKMSPHADVRGWRHMKNFNYSCAAAVGAARVRPRSSRSHCFSRELAACGALLCYM